MVSNHNAEQVGLPQKLAVLKSREQLRRIPDHMVPSGVVHSAEVLMNGTTSWLVSLDGENFVDALADPGDWTPDTAADKIAGVGIRIEPVTYTRAFLKQLVVERGGCLKFNVTNHAGDHNVKSRQRESRSKWPGHPTQQTIRQQPKSDYSINAHRLAPCKRAT